MDSHLTSNAVNAEGGGVIFSYLGQRYPQQRENAINTVLNNNDMRHLLSQEVMAQCEFRNKLGKQRPIYSTKAVGDLAGIAELQKAYPEYTIEQGCADTMTGHPFSKDSRHLDSRLVWDIFVCKNKNVELGRAPNGLPYDVMIKDVGSSLNEVMQTQKFSRFHCCTPTIGKSDVGRYYTNQKYLMNNAAALAYRRGDHASRRVLKSMLNCDGVNRCSMRAEYCSITAPYVTFVHSSYDLPMDSIIAILDQARCQQAYFVFLFDPKIMSSSVSGVIPNHNVRWTKFSINNVKHIRFDFNDGQDAYVHRLETYLVLIGAVRVRSRCGNHAYVFSVKRYKNYTLYVEASLDIREHAPSELIVRSLPYDVESDHIYVRTWKWTTCSINHMEPISIYCTRKYWDQVCTYARSLPVGKFTISNVFNSAASFNGVMYVGPAKVTGGHLHSEDVGHLASAAWIVTFISNYEAGKAQQAMRNDEERVRSENSRGRFASLLAKFLSSRVSHAEGSKTPAHPHDSQLVLKHYKSVDLDLFATLSSSDATHVDWYTKLFVWMFGDVVSHRRYPISISDAVTVVSVQAHMQECVNAVVCPTYPYFAPVRIDDIVHNITHNSVLESMCYSDVEKEKISCINAKHQCDAGPFEVVSVLGDGNCFYHSLAVLLNLPGDVMAIKLRLLHSRFLDKADMLIIERLSAESGVASWADNAVIELAALEYKICICIHAEPCQRFNISASTIIHMKLADNHFEPLVYKPQCEPLLSVTLPNFEDLDIDCDVAVENFNEWIKPTLRNIQPEMVRHDLSLTSTLYHKYNALNHCGFVNDYGILLSAAYKIYRDTSKSKPSILDVNPAVISSLELFVNKLQADVTSLRFSPITVDVKEHDIVYVEDFDKPEQALGDRRFDVINVNPSRYFDTLAYLNYDKYVADLHSNLRCLSTLKTGGTMTFGIPITPDLRMMKVVSALRKSFGVVKIIRSQFVPPHNPWLIIMCMDYSGEIPHICNVTSTVFELFKSICARYKPKILDAVNAIISKPSRTDVVCVELAEYDVAMEQLMILPYISGGRSRQEPLTFVLPSFKEFFDQKADTQGFKFCDLQIAYEKHLTATLITELSLIAEVNPPALLTQNWFDKLKLCELSDDEIQKMSVLYAMYKRGDTFLRTNIDMLHAFTDGPIRADLLVENDIICIKRITNRAVNVVATSIAEVTPSIIKNVDLCNAFRSTKKVKKPMRFLRSVFKRKLISSNLEKPTFEMEGDNSVIPFEMADKCKTITSELNRNKVGLKTLIEDDDSSSIVSEVESVTVKPNEVDELIDIFGKI